jgi:hypothetical protein
MRRTHLDKTGAFRGFGLAYLDQTGKLQNRGLKLYKTKAAAMAAARRSGNNNDSIISVTAYYFLTK